MASRQFFLDMAAATALSTQAKRDAAVSKVWAAEAARMTDPTPVPVPTPVPTPGRKVRPFSNASPFNTPIKAGATYKPWPGDEDLSKPLVTATATRNPEKAYGNRQGYYLAPTPYMVIADGKTTDPLWTLNCPTYGSPDPAFIKQYNRNRPAQTFKVRAPANLFDLVAVGETDDHVLFLTNGTTYWETWRTVVDTAAKTITATAWATGDIVTSPGAGTLGGLNDGVRAANSSWIAGTISAADIAQVNAQAAAGLAPTIDHALAFAGTNDMVQDSFIPPATGPEKHTLYGLPLGTRLAIKPGSVDTTGMTPLGQAVTYAVQTYGMFMVDSCGGEWPCLYPEPGTPGVPFDAVFGFWNPAADFVKVAAKLLIVT